jgi:hypothetical protein
MFFISDVYAILLIGSLLYGIPDVRQPFVEFSHAMCIRICCPVVGFFARQNVNDII